MPEQAPAVQNKKILIIALVLAAFVAVLFNIHVGQAAKAGRSKTVQLTAFARELPANAAVRESDLEPQAFPEEHLHSVPNALRWEHHRTAIGLRVAQPVQRGHFVTHGVIQGLGDTTSPVSAPSPGWTSAAFSVDRDGIPGDIILPNRRVDVWGFFRVNGQVQAVMVLEQVRVLSVGGRGAADLAAGQAAPARASYSNVAVDVPKPVAARLANLRTHAVGLLWVQALNPQDVPRQDPQINPLLEQLSQSAAAAGRGSRVEQWDQDQ